MGRCVRAASFFGLCVAVCLAGNAAIAEPQGGNPNRPPVMHMMRPHPGPPENSRANVGSCGGCGTPPLRYGGGAVQHRPRVFLVLWGSRWSTDGSGSSSAESTLFRSLGGSHWNQVLSQYTDSSSQVFNDELLLGTWTDPVGPSGTVDYTAVLNEAAHASAVNGWQHTADTQYFILPQQGSSISGAGSFCAWHSNGASGGNNFYFSLIPYVGDSPFASGCLAYGNGSVSQTMTYVSSHEYAETTTDPTPYSGWVTSDHSENGDLCAYAPGVGLFGVTVTMTWSNSDNQCVSSDPFPPYNSFLLHATSGITLADAPNFQWGVGDYNRDGIPDIYAIKVKNTGGTAEVHILNGANTNSFLLHATSGITLADAPNFKWAVGDYNRDGIPDVIAIKVKSTSGSAEVHILNGANTNSFLLHGTSAISLTDAPNFQWAAGDYNRDGTADVFAIKVAQTSGSAEVHILNGAVS